MISIQVKQLTKQFGSIVALHGLDLTINPGELFFLLGPSGCGKTTLLRSLAGFYIPEKGQILFGDEDVTRLEPHKRNTGMMFQSYALWPHMTVAENVAFGLEERKVPAAEIRTRVGDALASVRMEKYADRKPNQLSGGQQQRVALARALVIEPQILLLDEPLSNLDAHLRAEMRSEIRDLLQRLAITTVFVTHDQQEALAMADRVAVMSAGKLVEVGAPKALCDHPVHPFTASFLGARTVIEGRSRQGIFEAAGLRCEGAPDDASRLVLRAARLRFANQAMAPLNLEGVVVASAFIGDLFETDVETSAGRVRLLTPSDTDPPPLGAACHIQALPGGVSFIR